MYYFFVCLFFIDIKHHILPDELNLALAITFLLNALINQTLSHWILGGLIGFGLPFIVF